MSQTNIRTKGVAVVSGANRGIGLQVARKLGQSGMTVLMGARDAQRGEAAAAQLAGEGLDVRAVALDVTDQASVDALGASLERVDVLVNNAAILPNGTATDLDPAIADAAWQTNALGAWRLALAVIPLMRQQRWGRIVNVSSGAGSLADMSTHEPARRRADGPTGGFFRDGEPVPW